MSDLKKVCPHCGVYRSSVGEAMINGDPCPECGGELESWTDMRIREAKADAWDEGAIWGFDERGPIDGTHLQLVPDDNPYRATTTTKGN